MLRWLIALALAPFVFGDSTVVFNEIMYHPAQNEAAEEWVELYNQNAVDMDISGWSLSVGYKFPAGTILGGGKYLVVASSPEGLAARTGFAGAYGPFTNRLSNGGERLELRNNSGRPIDWVAYGTEGDWLVGPDGGGVSLAKLDPNATSRDAANWSGSFEMNGTPGVQNFSTGAALMVLQFNEIASSSATPFWIELKNRSASAIPLDGYQISSQGSIDATFTFPDTASIEPASFLVVDQDTLGFRPKSGDKLFLHAPARTRLLDAIVVKKTLRGRTSAGEWLFPSEETPGAENKFRFEDSIVINEIMYHSLQVKQNWLELFNRGTAAVDLSGWALAKAVDYTFPAGTVMNPGEYLVIAEDANVLHAAYPDIRILGNYTNTLPHGSGRIVLLDTGKNPADRTRYFDDYPWPHEPDGFGASLELRNPNADNSSPEAWAASDEGSRSGWKSYSYSAVARSDGGPTLWKEFVFGLLDAGEVLVDDLSVIQDPDTAPREMLQNGSFENGDASYRYLGTQRRSHVIVDPDNAANHVLDLIATGTTEHMHNHIETTLAGGQSVTNGKKYKISFRAKWLSGSANINTRLYFDRVAKVTVLDRPLGGGTPGRQNSRYEQNIGPTVDKFAHSPVVPSSSQPVAVTVHANDPDGVKGCTLWWGVNGSNWTSIAMVPTDGGGYTASVPAKPAATIVQFYVEAEDLRGAKSVYPAGGRSSRAIYEVSDGQSKPGKIHQYRMILLPAEAADMHAHTNVMGNDERFGTFLSDEREAIYNARVHLQSSERGRDDPNRVGFTIGFPADHLFRGVHNSITFDKSGGWSGRGGKHDEIIIRHVGNAAGGTFDMYNDLCRFIAPSPTYTGTAMLLMSKYNSEFLDSAFDHGADGSMFKIELIYYPTTTVGSDPQKPKLPQPDDVIGSDFGSTSDDPEGYRWFFLAENHSDRNDYSGLIGLSKMFSLSGAALEQKAWQMIDVDQWTRTFALKTLSGDADTYGWGYTHNQLFYVHPTGRIYTFPWDMDFSWARGATDALNAGAKAGDMINSSFAMHRLFYGHVLDIVNKSYNTNYIGRWTTHYAGLVGQNYSGILTYIDQRSKAARSQLPPKVVFSITTNNGQDFSTNASSIKIQGKTWIDAKSIVLEGSTNNLPLTWTSLSNWETTLPLVAGPNRISLVPLNYDAAPMSTNIITITSTIPSSDSDGDGMPDDWEMKYGLDPARNDALEDFDHDGVSNINEYKAGTNPADPSSKLILMAVMQGSQLKLSFSTKAGKSYHLDYRVDLTGPWSQLAKVPSTPQDGAFEMTQTISPVAKALYYRIVLGP